MNQFVEEDKECEIMAILSDIFYLYCVGLL